MKKIYFLLLNMSYFSLLYCVENKINLKTHINKNKCEFFIDNTFINNDEKNPHGIIIVIHLHDNNDNCFHYNFKEGNSTFRLNFYLVIEDFKNEIEEEREYKETTYFKEYIKKTYLNEILNFIINNYLNKLSDSITKISYEEELGKTFTVFTIEKEKLLQNFKDKKKIQFNNV